MSTAETTVNSASRHSVRPKFITSTQSLTTHNCIWDSGRLCEQTMLVKEHIVTCRPTSTVETFSSTQRLVLSLDLPYLNRRADATPEDAGTNCDRYLLLFLALAISILLTIVIFAIADAWYKRKARRALERSAARVAVHGGQSVSRAEGIELNDLAQRPQTNPFEGSEDTREESASSSRPSSRTIRRENSQIRGREEDEEYGRAESSARVSKSPSLGCCNLQGRAEQQIVQYHLGRNALAKDALC